MQYPKARDQSRQYIHTATAGEPVNATERLTDHNLHQLQYGTISNNGLLNPL